MKDFHGQDFVKAHCTATVTRSKKGIKRDLFNVIVDKHLPRRNQVLITILKFTSVIFVLTISVELLTRFHKFQELSLLTHVFTVLFVCSLPKIIRISCMQSYRRSGRRKLRHKLYGTICEYAKNGKAKTSDTEDEEENQHFELSMMS